MSSRKYSNLLATRICTRLAKGETIQQIVKTRGMPTLESIINWRRRYEDFDQMYRVAQESKADILADETIDKTREVFALVLQCSLCQGTGEVVPSKKVKTTDGPEDSRVHEEALKFDKGKVVCPNCYGSGKNQDQKALVQALDKYQKSMQWLSSRLRPGVYGDNLKPEPETPPGMLAKIEINLTGGSGAQPRIIEAHAKEITDEAES